MKPRNHLIASALMLALVAFAAAAPASAGSFDEQMNKILDAYIPIPQTLAADKTEGVTQHAQEIATLAKSLKTDNLEGMHAKHFQNLPQNLGSSAKELAEAKDLDGMREALKELSKPMAMWATMAKPEGVSVMFCSMAKGSWLQQNDTTIANPYYGSQMLRCGEIVAGKGADKGHGGGMKMKDHGMHHGGH